MRILITAGPTREFFDSVRFISNPSSGRMGFAIAAEAARRGYDVILISGPVELADPPGVDVQRVVTAQEMYEAATSVFVECHAAVMCAAVCDYRPAQRLEHKLKKGDGPRMVALEPTPDICMQLGKLKGDRVVVGFAMEDHDHRQNAEDKLIRKGCDAMILNGVASLGSELAEIEILRADSGWSKPVKASKIQLAAHVVDLVEDLLGLSG
ncbi:MAG: phosphopantothenoylcysteine decarboxylase [Planctomycetes bacterium]|nr:phosphopantothenoylcysteine decarboxylase [Planctomycetota bacterium]